MTTARGRGEDDSVLAFTAGDAAAADHLRAALRGIADEHAGTPLGRLVESTLAGRTEMRALADDPDFVALTSRGARAYQEAWQSLDPEQRARLTEQAERALDEAEPTDRPPS